MNHAFVRANYERWSARDRGSTSGRERDETDADHEPGDHDVEDAREREREQDDET